MNHAERRCVDCCNAMVPAHEEQDEGDDADDADDDGDAHEDGGRAERWR